MNENAVDYVQQAITLMQQGKYEEAVTFADKSLREDLHYKEAYEVKADALVNLGRNEEALSVYQQALLIDPEDGELYFNIGNIYVLLDDIVKCLKNYNKAEQLGYRYYGLYKNLADIYRELDKPDMALVNYNKAIAEDPFRAEFRLEKAGYQITLGKFHEALETLEELQTLEPDLYDAIAMRAEIYSGLNQHEEALNVIDDAIEQLSDDVALKVEKAKLLISAGRLDDAMKVISKVKEMDDYEAVSRSALLTEAQILSMKVDLQGTRKVLKEIVEGQENYDEEVQYLLLNTEFALANYDNALMIAESLANRPEENLFSVSGKFYVPQILQKLGKEEEAKKHYRELTSYLRRVTINSPHFYEGYLYRLLCHKELGEYDKALELADYIENLNPSSSDAYAMRYAIYKDMKQEDKALEMKEIVAKINPELQL